MIKQKSLCTRGPTRPHSINWEKQVATSELLSYKLIHYLYVCHVAFCEDVRPVEN